MARSVERAAERGRLTTIDDSEARMVGVLAGLLPQAHLFEFRADADESIIRGKVYPSIAASDLTTMNRQWLVQPAVAVLNARRVLKNGESVRTSYTLLRLEPTPVTISASHG